MWTAKTLQTLAGALAAAALAAGPAAGAPASDEPREDSGSRVLSDADSYVRLPSVQTSVRSRGGRRVSGDMLQVTLALDVPEARVRSLVERRELWLRDAFSETLLLYAARIYRPGEVPDADMIARLLQDDVDRLLGEDRATVVLDTVILHAG